MRYSPCFALLLFFVATCPAIATEQFRPNIVLINFDDADTDLLSPENLQTHYPNLNRIANRSIHFTNAHCTTPFCAPSRAALFTGQYAFNNGCKVNDPGLAVSNGFAGSYSEFKKRGHRENELGVWMQDAGYRTVHVGKYHHTDFDDVVPVGWDAISVASGDKFFNTRVFTNIGVARPRAFQTGQDTYVSRFHRGQIEQALQSHFSSNSDSPFFLSWAPMAPHLSGDSDLSRMVEPRYLDYASDLSQPTSDPDYDESDMSDKPDHIARTALTQAEKERFAGAWINRLRSIKSVDDALGELVDQIEAAEELSRTIFIVTSDNGYSLGHHRQWAKKDPYNRSTAVPLMVALPDSTSPRFGNHLIAHIDICPTILDLAAVPVPDEVDGKSFVPLVDSTWSGTERNWQRSIMIENWADKSDRAGRRSMVYVAERFYESIYIAWANGAREYYDLATDPYQLQNSYDGFPEFTRQFLADSLRNFRSGDVLPTSTLSFPAQGSDATPEMNFGGYLEDNSAPVAARLFVRSHLSGRFFNGKTWTDRPSWIMVPADQTDASISTWSTKLNVFTEAPGHFDVLVAYVHAVDDDGRQGSLDLGVFPARDLSLWAEFNPILDGRQFTADRRIRLTGYFGRLPGSKAQVVIRSATNGMYANSSGQLQTNWVSLPSNNLPNNRWTIDVSLPSDDYQAFVRAVVPEKGQYQFTPTAIDFKVR